MEEKEESDKKFSLFRRKSTKKDHSKYTGLNAVGERLSDSERSATLPSQSHAHPYSAMTPSPSVGLFSKFKRKFRFRGSSKGKYDFKDYDDVPQRLRRKSDDPLRMSEQSDMETVTAAKLTSSVKTPRRSQNDKENVILIRKNKCISVICQDADGSSEVIFSNMPPSEDDDSLSESWGDGSEEDPYATIKSVKEELKERFSNHSEKSDQNKKERDRVRAKELLQHSMESNQSASKTVDNVNQPVVECVKVEDLYAKINSKTKGNKSRNAGITEGRITAANTHNRFEHEYESLEDVKKRASELFEDKTGTDGGANCSDKSVNEFRIEPDYETLEEVRQKVLNTARPTSTNSVNKSSLEDEDAHNDLSTRPSALNDPASPNASINTTNASKTPSSKSSSPGCLAPLAISIDSSLPCEDTLDTASKSDCIYDNPNVILRKQVFRCSLGASLSPHHRRSLVFSEPPLTKKTPAEEELVEKLSSLLAPPLPLRNYHKEEVGKGNGCGNSRHSWSSVLSTHWDMSESWHGGSEASHSSCIQENGMESVVKNTVRSKSQEFCDEVKGKIVTSHNKSKDCVRQVSNEVERNLQNGKNLDTVISESTEIDGIVEREQNVEGIHSYKETDSHVAENGKQEIVKLPKSIDHSGKSEVHSNIVRTSDKQCKSKASHDANHRVQEVQHVKKIDYSVKTTRPSSLTTGISCSQDSTVSINHSNVSIKPSSVSNASQVKCENDSDSFVAVEKDVFRTDASIIDHSSQSPGATSLSNESEGLCQNSTVAKYSDRNLCSNSLHQSHTPLCRNVCSNSLHQSDTRSCRNATINAISLNNTAKEKVLLRKPNEFVDAQLWKRKRKSGPNASPDQDMAIISKAFEHEEFQSGFSGQYNAQDEERNEGESKMGDLEDTLPLCAEAIEIESVSIAPICGCENYNDCICNEDLNYFSCDSIDDNGNAHFSHSASGITNLIKDTNYFLHENKLILNDTSQIEDENSEKNNLSSFIDVGIGIGSALIHDTHHIQSKTVSDEGALWEEIIAPSNYSLVPSSQDNYEPTHQQSSNQRLFLQMARLLENVINGFCQEILAIEPQYLLVGVFKWARCFHLTAQDDKWLEDKLKVFLLQYRSEILSKWNKFNDRFEEKREQMQSDVDAIYKRIRIGMKTSDGLPTFLDLRLSLFGGFLLQYKLMRPQINFTLFPEEALRVSQQELGFFKWAMSTGIWVPGYDFKQPSLESSDTEIENDEMGASGSFQVDSSNQKPFSMCTFSGECDSVLSSNSSSPMKLSPFKVDGAGCAIPKGGILSEFFSMCDNTEEESDEEEEKENVDVYINTVTAPAEIRLRELSIYNFSAMLSLCRAFHGELAYMCRVRTPRRLKKIAKESKGCLGRRSHLSNSAWEDMDQLMKKLVPHISPRLDFQFLLRTYAEFKFFVLKDRRRNRNCFQIDTECGVHCCRKEEMVFLKLIRDELRHFANVVNQSSASKSLFLEEKDVGYSLTTLLNITLTTLDDMKSSGKRGRKCTSYDTASHTPEPIACFYPFGSTVVPESIESSDEEGSTYEGEDGTQIDRQDISERHLIGFQEKVEFHINNYKSYRAGNMWFDLDRWQPPAAYLDDPNVLDLKNGKSFFVDRETNVVHSHSTWGHYEEPKPLQEREDFLESMQQLQLREWYWGPLSYEQAATVLQNHEDGSFLVRDSSDRKYLLSLSFKSLGEVYHTRIEHAKGLFSFWSQPDSHGKAKICEFIEKSIQNSHDGKFLYFLRPRDLGNPPLPIRLLNPVSRNFKIPSLRHLTRFVIRQTVRRDHIDHLPIPQKVKNYLRQKQFYVEF